MTTIVQYRKMLGWTQSELARRAKLTNNTVRRAEKRELVSGGTATAIAEKHFEKRSIFS